MYINLKKIKIHNFMSFGDAEVELSRRGFTLISGQNLNPVDNAKSNGSGKSVIWDALAWCLTGETVRGVRGNLINLYNTATECFVAVNFDVDNHNFEILRSQDNQKGGKLTFSIDGIDKSGKGIRDTEKVLSEYLPELTSNLIGSVIILGQGLPCRFSDNTPSGRKEVLEKLSQSDFMIEDLKTRLTKIIDMRNHLLAEIRGNLTELTYKKKVREKELANAQAKLNNLPDVLTLDQRVVQLQRAVEASENLYLQYKSQGEKLSQSYYETDTAIKALDDKYKSISSTLQCEYLNERNPVLIQLQSVKAERDLVLREIKQLNSIVDICPTCGQKIQGVHKPDTTQQCKRHQELQDLILQLETQVSNIDQQYEKKKNEQLSQSSRDRVTLQTHLTGINRDIRDNKNLVQQQERVCLDTKQQLLSAQSDKMHYQDDLRELKEDIESFTQEIQQIDSQILYKTNEEAKETEKLDIVNKMLTLAKRDFRGFLLSGIIEYIDNPMIASSTIGVTEAK